MEINIVNKNTFYTYLHCKPDGTPFYVGMGHDNRYKRFKTGRNKYYLHIVSKYGKENILVYLFQCESSEQAKLDEIQQIAQLKHDGYELCNMTAGGEGTLNPSEEMRRRNSVAHLGNKYALGYKHTDEAKAKMKITNKGRTHWLGRHHSEETKAKLSAINKGKPNPFLGRKHSQESKAKMSVSHKKPWSDVRRAAFERKKNEK